MTSMTHSHPAADPREAMTPEAAIRQAWIYWLGLATVPLLVLFVGLFRLLADARFASSAYVEEWFIGSMVLVALLVPLGFWLRERAFRRYMKGHRVAPKDYVRGQLMVWLAAVTGGVVSSLGVVLFGEVLPLVIPGLVAFVFYVTVYPNGKAMTMPTGDTDDPSVYSEPR